jgi:hypothetical protein
MLLIVGVWVLGLAIPSGMVFKDKFLQTYEEIARLSS